MKPEVLMKNSSRPVRFDPPEEKILRDIAKETGLSLSEIIRRCCAYAAPKFLAGSVNILNLKRVR